MHNSKTVTFGKRIQYRPEQHKRPLRTQRTRLAQLMAQIVTMEHLHGNVRLRRLLNMTKIVYRNDVIVMNLGGNLGLAKKTFRIARIDPFLEIHDLERHVAIDRQVVRPIDRGKPTHTQNTQNFVAIINAHAHGKGRRRHIADLGIGRQNLAGILKLSRLEGATWTARTGRRDHGHRTLVV